MEPMRLNVNLSDIQDAKTEQNEEFLSSVISVAKTIVRRGGTVTFQQEYGNGPTDKFLIMTTIEQVDQWIDQYF